MLEVVVDADAGGVALAEAQGRARDAAVEGQRGDGLDAVAGRPGLLGDGEVVFDQPGVQGGGREEQEQKGFHGGFRRRA